MMQNKYPYEFYNEIKNCYVVFTNKNTAFLKYDNSEDCISCLKPNTEFVTKWLPIKEDFTHECIDCYNALQKPISKIGVKRIWI